MVILRVCTIYVFSHSPLRDFFPTPSITFLIVRPSVLHVKSRLLSLLLVNARAVESPPHGPGLQTLGSLSKSTFQGDAVVKSAKARDSRHRSRAKFNLLSTDATRLGGLHSQILAYLIPLSLLWHVLKSFVRFFSSYNDASLISHEDYI